MVLLLQCVVTCPIVLDLLDLYFWERDLEIYLFGPWLIEHVSQTDGFPNWILTVGPFSNGNWSLRGLLSMVGNAHCWSLLFTCPLHGLRQVCRLLYLSSFCKIRRFLTHFLIILQGLRDLHLQNYLN